MSYSLPHDIQPPITQINGQRTTGRFGYELPKESNPLSVDIYRIASYMLNLEEKAYQIQEALGREADTQSQHIRWQIAGII